MTIQKKTAVSEKEHADAGGGGSLLENVKLSSAPLHDDSGYDADSNPIDSGAPLFDSPAGGSGDGASGGRRSQHTYSPLRAPLDSGPPGQGMAFNIDRTIASLRGECQAGPGGRCLGNLADALQVGGFNVRDGLPIRGKSRWAKDLSPALQHDGRFDTVSVGHGSQRDAGYAPKVGDIAVWEGGSFGHTQMFAGYNKNGGEVWMSDFQTREGNWTGLKDPGSHGTVKIFRQHTVQDSGATLAAKDTGPAHDGGAAAKGTSPGHGVTAAGQEKTAAVKPKAAMPTA